MKKTFAAALFCVVLLLACLAAAAGQDLPAPGKQVLLSIIAPVGQPYRSPEEADLPGEEYLPSEEPLTEIPYWLFLPVNESEKTEKGFPLLLFLHGAGERGDPVRLRTVGIPELADRDGGTTWPFITVSPVCPSESRWSAEQILPILDRVTAEYPVDPDRVYVMGISMGGYGTWMILSKAPDRFAAGVPLCGGCDPANAPKLLDVPIWAFHGDADDVVLPKRSIAIFRAIKALGGEKARLTLFCGCGHDCWGKSLGDGELFRWLLSQSR